MTNPALAPYDISNYQGIKGKNFFEIDIVLQDLLLVQDFSQSENEAIRAHLAGYGKLCSEVLDPLVQAAHRENKYGELVRFDRTGNRIDAIEYCYEQKEVRRLAYEYGIVNLDFHPNWRYPFTMFHKMALAYLSNQMGEAGLNCPLAMTDGMIKVLKAIGSPEQQRKYLPLIAGYGSSSHFMCGQYVTERVGGSNVSANRTVARPLGNGKWLLTGEKWFCSNPGDLWVTTARVEGTPTIGLFLVSRYKEDGSLNGCHLLRKKEIMGSRGKLTCEAIYEDCEAEELGRPAHGLVNLIKYVINTSRLHVAVAALGMMRRALAEASAYVQQREAYGKKIIAYPSVRKILSQIFVSLSGMVLLSFYNFKLAEEEHLLSQLLTPLLKYITTSRCTRFIHECMLLHGGNGILLDFSVLPRLLNDSIINETWEGTHQIISEHVLKAYQRPKVAKALNHYVEETFASCPAPFKSELHSLREIIFQELSIFAESRESYAEMNRLYFCERLFDLLVVIEAIRHYLKMKGKKREELYLAILRGLFELARRDFHGPAEKTGVFVPGPENNLLLSAILWEEKT
ncbi:MAG: acyl-CoA dehydrogenase family protein [Leptospiraceae bacterium]|nr:acyl-CoA dehydrogenase family protein [Leptospiraceae bacterium]MDW8307353.1 acyl-CoA dehydrogenase family protein [Leptospiraceae bacterium]